MSFFLKMFGLTSPPPAASAMPTTDAALEAELPPEIPSTVVGAGEQPPAPAELPVERKILGAVDGFRPPGSFTGWALDQTNPGVPLPIQVLLDGQEIAAGVTSFARPDLWKAENKAGFGIDTGRSIDPEQIVQKKIEIRAGGAPIAIWSGLMDRLKVQA